MSRSGMLATVRDWAAAFVGGGVGGRITRSGRSGLIPTRAIRLPTARRRGLAATLALFAGLVLAGCGGDPPVTPATSGTSSAPAASGGALAPAVTSAGGSEPFGAHWDWSRYEQFTPYLRKLAGSPTYYELTWCDIEETAGHPDWSALDQVASRSRDLGIALSLKIRTGICWATGGGAAQHVRGAAEKTESGMPASMAAYQRFVGSVVRRYQPYGVRAYAIENEVNSQSYWSGTPQQYLQLVRAAAQTIRATDPHALVVDSGISSVAYGMGIADRLLSAGRVPEAIAAYTAYFQRRIGTRGQQIPAVTTEAQLRKALGNQANARNLRFLTATKTLLDEHVVDVRQVHFYEHFSGVPALVDYLRAQTPAGMPIEAWEVGQFWQDGADDSAARAAELVKTVNLLVAGGIRQVVWLPLAYNPDNEAGSEVRYGLLDPDGTEREAGRMMAALAGVARDATISPLPTSAAGRLAGATFVHGTQTTLVLWSASATPVTVAPSTGVRSGPVGGALQPVGAAGTKVTETPVVLQANQPADQILASLR
jgi:hypothetical protein